jgi:hypothetical protein
VSAIPTNDTGLANNGVTTYLGRGDSMNLTLGNRLATTWIFSKAGTDALYDLKYTSKANGNYFFTLTPDKSMSLNAGSYWVVLQYNGPNALKEVSYNQSVNISGALQRYLTSPYKSVKDVPISGLQPSMVYNALKEMIKTTADDKLVEWDMEVQEPNTVIRAIDQVDDNTVYIAGTSNLRVGTPISLLWDEERQVSNLDIRENTFTTNVTPANGTSINQWSLEADVDLQNMPVGRHWVAVTAGGLTTRTYHDIREGFGNGTIPTPTIRYLDSGVVVTPTPMTVIETKEVTVIQTVIQTVVITTQPFPKNALGEEYNPSEKPSVDGLVFPLACVGIAILVLRKARFE